MLNLDLPRLQKPYFTLINQCHYWPGENRNSDWILKMVICFLLDLIGFCWSFTSTWISAVLLSVMILNPRAPNMPISSLYSVRTCGCVGQSWFCCSIHLWHAVWQISILACINHTLQWIVAKSKSISLDLKELKSDSTNICLMEKRCWWVWPLMPFSHKLWKPILSCPWKQLSDCIFLWWVRKWWGQDEFSLKWGESYQFITECVSL